MFKFLHAADIHLDSPLLRLDVYEGAPAAEIRGATRRAFENLVQTALAEKVDFVVLAGDIYDGDWKDYNTGLHFAARIARLREAGIPVILAAGNHDAASSISRSLRLPDNARVFPHDRPDTFRLESVNVAVHGQSFGSPAVRADLSRGYPAPVPGCFNVGLLHTGVNGREGHEPYAPCTLAALREKGYDYWALGHVHQREVLSAEPLVVFPGNTQGRHARETGAKGCILVTRGRCRAGGDRLPAAGCRALGGGGRRRGRQRQRLRPRRPLPSRHPRAAGREPGRAHGRARAGRRRHPGARRPHVRPAAVGERDPRGRGRGRGRTPVGGEGPAGHARAAFDRRPAPGRRGGRADEPDRRDRVRPRRAGRAGRGAGRSGEKAAAGIPGRGRGVDARLPRLAGRSAGGVPVACSCAG